MSARTFVRSVISTEQLSIKVPGIVIKQQIFSNYDNLSEINTSNIAENTNNFKFVF